jgi:hypothetical protein
MPVRIRLAAKSRPRAPLIDENTGEPVEFYSLNDVAMALGIFDASGFAIDPSNIAYLSVDLLQSPESGIVLATTVVPTSDLDQPSAENWAAALDQTATLSFGANQLSLLNFFGRPSHNFWMVVHGITEDGEDIVYGAGWIRIFNAGVTTLYLPLYPPPTVIPAGTTYFIPAGVTITMTQAPQIFGALVMGPATATLPAGQLIIT